MKNTLHYPKKNKYKFILRTKVLLSFLLCFIAISLVAQSDEEIPADGAECPAEITSIEFLTPSGELLCPGGEYPVVVRHDSAVGTGSGDGMYVIGLVCGESDLGRTSDDTIQLTLAAGTNTYFASGLLANQVCPFDGECDSLTVTTNDTVKPTPELSTLPVVTGLGSVAIPLGTQRPTALDNCPIPIYGETTPSDTVFTEVGVHTVTWTYTDLSGNDTTQTQDFEVLPGGVYAISDTICEGDSIAFDGGYVSETGYYVDTIPLTVGDSVIQLTLLVSPEVDLTGVGFELVTAFGTILRLDSNFSTASVSFQWLDCDDNYAAIPDAILPFLTNVEEGASYTVEITDVTGCGKDTITECFTVTSVNELKKGALSIYPNPAVDRLELRFQDELLGKNVTLVVYNTLGEKVMEKTVVDATANYTIEIGVLESGMYYLEVMDIASQSRLSHQFVKE